MEARVETAPGENAKQRLLSILQKLTGEPVPYPDRITRLDLSIDPEKLELGWSQLNELLLLGGLDRVTQTFFAYLLTGGPDYTPGAAFSSLASLEARVEEFRKMALLRYGNVKFAFKSLSSDANLLISDLEASSPVDLNGFHKRHDPILPIENIAPNNAYLTGYIIQQELRERLSKNPDDVEAKTLEDTRHATVEVATRNHAAYLASDHLDVYVATSMRSRNEFMAIGQIVREIFSSDVLTPLKLRYFDPTQAYCLDRIDKGLAEALMLRRASCTIYLAQESDTLGKDSELASTLAQGKPVIAYVPDVTTEYLDAHFAILQTANPHLSFPELLLRELQLYEPSAAWTDSTVRSWCDKPQDLSAETLKARVSEKIHAHFQKRASLLRDAHPLGIQVNLQTGVANGVLVVRTVHDCARLVRGIVTGTLEFDLEENEHSTVLREKISGSIFRVMTRDQMLTNTFWNFYLS